MTWTSTSEVRFAENDLVFSKFTKFTRRLRGSTGGLQDFFFSYQYLSLLSSQNPVSFSPTWSEKGKMEQMARTTKSTFSSPRCRWNTNSLASCSSPGWRVSVRSVHVVRHLHIPALSIHPSLATISCVLHVCVCMFVQVFFSPFFLPPSSSLCLFFFFKFNLSS